jgi:hypothetical protein
MMCKRAGRQITMRTLHEHNGDWYPLSNTQDIAVHIQIDTLYHVVCNRSLVHTLVTALLTYADSCCDKYMNQPILNTCHNVYNVP